MFSKSYDNNSGSQDRRIATLVLNRYSYSCQIVFSRTSWLLTLQNFTFDTESTWRHHMEVDSEYIYVDLLDTAGEVRLKVLRKLFQVNFLGEL